MRSPKTSNIETVLSIDFGTQSVRGIIFDQNGNMLAKEKIEYNPYFSKKPGWAEQDPEVYWKNMCLATKKLKSSCKEYWKDIRAVVITSLRDTSICLDSSGKVLRPAIVWLDQRNAAGSPKIPAKVRPFVKLIGMSRAMDILFKRSFSNWIIENEPEIWAKTDKYVQLSGFINYRLTGEMADSVASQIGHIPFDFRKRKWMSPKNFKTCLFNIDQSKLSRLVAPGSEIGRITKKASSETGLHEGIPVLAGGSDKGCETLGVGCMDETVASLSFGTTATIQTTSKKYYEPIRFLPPYPAVIPGCYNPEIEIFRGYWLISWFKREFSKKELVEATQKKIAPEELLNKRLSEVPPGCHGLLLQPLWSPDILNPNAKGSVIGFGDVHTHSHLYRAIIEGINFSLIEGLEKIEKKSGIHVDSLAVSGGGSQSDEICQITSDMFNRPVKKPATYETSALGAAIIGFVGSGYYPTFEDAIKNMCHYSKIFSPRPEIAAIYKNLYHKVYVNIFPKLKPLYDEIQKITNYPEI